LSYLLMIRRQPRSTQGRASAASDGDKRQDVEVDKREIAPLCPAQQHGGQQHVEDAETEGAESRAVFDVSDQRILQAEPDDGRAEQQDTVEIVGLLGRPFDQSAAIVGGRRCRRIAQHTAALIVQLQPKVAVIENVPTLAWDEHGPLFDELAGGDEATFTHAVLSESMRLYPPAWLIGRLALEDVTIRDVLVPRRSVVIISQYVMHRDPRFWPDPERFDPSRFLNGAERPKFVYFPFGGGPRLCIGEHFAIEVILVGSGCFKPQRMLSGVEMVELCLGFVPEEAGELGESDGLF